MSQAKRAAGEAGAALVESGMRLGLGTGSTTAFALRALGRCLRVGDLSDVIGVPTSPAAAQIARDARIPLTTLDALDGSSSSGGGGGLDLALDGADEVDPALDLIKGRGGAHAREKVVAAEAERFVVLADPSKRVEQLGEHAPVPVEVMPMAVAPVRRFLQAWGASEARLRTGAGKDGPVVTDQGLWILDAYFSDGIAASSPGGDAAALDRALAARPGVLDHGLFLQRTTDVLIGTASGAVEHLRRKG